ncbi:MAG: 3-oxoacyl-ACP reductase FabG [Akkermansia sp.]|nr:3-oxoacyl-ACP reductase FabG [Akkermansia sp.]
MPHSSSHKWCLITGSSRGIGAAIARKLAAEGYAIILHARNNRQACDNLAAELTDAGTPCRVLMFDIADREATTQALKADIEEHGAYYGIVCNAGITRDTPFPAMEGEQWDAVLRTDLDSFYNILSPCVMPMIQNRKGGRIITISSVSGVAGNRGQVNYSAAKAGIIGATKALALELAKRKITVNCIAPGIIETDMIEGLPLDEMQKMVPLRRLGKPEDIAATVAFLMSDGASYITRQVINVNGGLV